MSDNDTTNNTGRPMTDADDSPPTDTQFTPAVPLLRIESGILVAAFVTQTFGFALLSLHRHRALLLANLVGLALTAGLTAILASTDGARGAAVAVVIGEVGLAVAMLVAFARNEPRPKVSLLPFVRVGVAAAVAVGGAVLIGGPSVVMALVGTALFGAAAFALGAVPDELIDVVRRRRSR